MQVADLYRYHRLDALSPDLLQVCSFWVAAAMLMDLGEPRAAWKLYRATVVALPVLGEPMPRAQFNALHIQPD